MKELSLHFLEELCSAKFHKCDFEGHLQLAWLADVHQPHCPFRLEVCPLLSGMSSCRTPRRRARLEVEKRGLDQLDEPGATPQHAHAVHAGTPAGSDEQCEFKYLTNAYGYALAEIMNVLLPELHQTECRGLGPDPLPVLSSIASMRRHLEEGGCRASSAEFYHLRLILGLVTRPSKIY